MPGAPRPPIPAALTGDFSSLRTYLGRRGLTTPLPGYDVLPSLRRVHRVCFSLAVWDSGLPFRRNPARVLLRQARSDAISSIPLALQGAAKATALLERSVLEDCLKYAYFFHHPVELERTRSEPRFIITIEELCDYASRIARLPQSSAKPDLIPRLRDLYWQCSMEVHGRNFNRVGTAIVLADNRFRQSDWETYSSRFCQIGGVVNMLLFAFHRDAFGSFPPDLRRAIQLSMEPRQWRACLSS
jgi:hypothetical protein